MNIFYLDQDAKLAARQHCDKHVVKMILEYAQLLSTAHRIIDGKQVQGFTQSGRKAKRWVLDDNREDVLYKATHVNHPSAVWARQSKENYEWLYNLFVECCKEYTHRYGKTHATQIKLEDTLKRAPINLKKSTQTLMPQAMPPAYKHIDPVKGYRTYYREAKREFCKWTNREQPEWF